MLYIREPHNNRSSRAKKSYASNLQSRYRKRNKSIEYNGGITSNDWTWTTGRCTAHPQRGREHRSCITKGNEACIETTAALSALAQEAVLGERLLEVVPPCRKVRVRVRLNVPEDLSIYHLVQSTEDNLLVDVSCRREVRRVAADVDVVRVLVDANPVDFHLSWEGEMVEIDEAEVRRHSQVGDDVL